MTVPYGFCHCGCGQKTKVATKNVRKHGYVRGEPYRFIVGHTNKINHTVDSQTGCWIWGGKLNGNGYAVSTRNHKSVRLARWLYERTFGALSVGMHVDHICRNRACINPYHLRPLTPRDNQLASPLLKLTKDKAREIRRLRSSGKTFSAIGSQFGISKRYVFDIVKRDAWKDA